MAEATDLLFVYGTLRKGHTNPMAQYLANRAEFVTEGWFQGRMYLISYYPGVIASETPDDRVYGEVYRLRQRRATLQVLDDYEACSATHPQPAEYTRVRASIHAADGSILSPVWIYLYQWPVAADAHIASGRFPCML